MMQSFSFSYFIQKPPKDLPNSQGTLGGGGELLDWNWAFLVEQHRLDEQQSCANALSQRQSPRLGHSCQLHSGGSCHDCVSTSLWQTLEFNSSLCKHQQTCF